MFLPLMPVLVWDLGYLDDFFRRTNGAIQWHRNLVFLWNNTWTMDMSWIVSKLAAPSRSTLHKTMCQFRIWEANLELWDGPFFEHFWVDTLYTWRLKTTTIWALLQLFLERSSIVGLSSKINRPLLHRPPRSARGKSCHPWHPHRHISGGLHPR